jgi:hypothetical protein
VTSVYDRIVDDGNGDNVIDAADGGYAHTQAITWSSVTNSWENVLTNVHTGYTLNSDACVTCHAVHQGYNDVDLADNAKDKNDFLLYKHSEICMACHDGTVTSTYDVEHGHIADATVNGRPALSNGGLFAVEAAGTPENAVLMSASQHDVFAESLYDYDAPGGAGAAGADNHGIWTDTSYFSCVSCHDPHGKGGNARLLQPNPNSVMNQGGGYGERSNDVVFGVNYFELFDFATTPWTSATAKYYIKNGKENADTVDALGVAYDTSRKVPGFRPQGARDSNYHINYTLTKDNGTTKTDMARGGVAYLFNYDVTEVAGVNKVDCYFTFPVDPGAVKVLVSYTPVLEVEMAIAHKLEANETIRYGKGMTEFCAACHYDYALSKTVIGEYTGKAHHTGNRSNSYVQLGNAPVKTTGGVDLEIDAIAGNSTGSCLTCHFAHGVDATRWGDAGDRTVAQVTNDPKMNHVTYKNAKVGYGSLEAYYAAIDASEANPEKYLTKESIMTGIGASSQNKRLPNTGACVLCHAKNQDQFTDLTYAKELATP